MDRARRVTDTAVQPVLFLQLYATLGGAENALLHLLAQLDRERFPPRVVVGREGPLVERLVAMGIDVTVVPFPARPLWHLAFPWVAFPLMRAALRIRGLARGAGVRIVQTGDVVGLLLALPSRLAGVKVVYQANHVGGALRRAFTRALARRAADRLVAFTAAHRDRVVGDDRVLCSRTAVIAPGIDVEAPAPVRGAARSALGLPAHATLVGMVARFDAGKGHDVFLRAMARLRERHDLVAVVVGGGLNDDVLPHVHRYREHVFDEARGLDLGERLRFLGHVPNAREAMAALDVLVCPSLDEPFGLVVVEGLALGVPVVVSDRGGPPEIVDHERGGLTFTAGDDGSLAQRLRELLDDPGRRRRLSAAGRERARSAYSRERYAGEMAALYASLA